MTSVERKEPPHIMLVAGEASGDLHGAALCRALRTLAPRSRLFGMGGARMAAAGMELLADITGTAVVGFSEVLRQFPVLRRAYRRLATALVEGRPAVLVLIDFPGMNLRLAREARRVGVPVVYFIPPQIWAWRPGRVEQIRERVSLVLAAFPFEHALYGSAGVPAEFVGHPALDAVAAAPSRSAARRQLGLAEGSLVLGLLPGSRRQELERMTPLMREAAARIARAHTDARFVLGLAEDVDARIVERALRGGPPVQIVPGGAYAVMRAADLLLITSGTATLEAALLGTPMVVCYRVSRFSELVGRAVLRVPWIALPNIILGRAVVPDLFMRRDATAARLAGEALRLLDTPGALATQREAFAELAAVLGDPGVGARAARLVLAAAGDHP